MPSRIGERVTTLLQDKRVSKQELEELLTATKTGGKYTAELKQELQAILDTQGTRFERGVKRSLQRFLAETPTQADLADPQILSKHATTVTWNPVAPGGGLFVDGVSFDDVVQGSIANCYMASAFSSLAHANPELIKSAFTDHGDGTYTVRFFERSYSGPPKEVKVTVDSDLPTETAGRSKYGKARDTNEHWVTMLEKAYAQWKGGYEAIGNGGNAGTVFEALTGKRSDWTSTSYSSADQLFSRLTTATKAGKPVTAGTHGKDSGVDYTGTGIYAWHAYTVMGTSEEAGTKYVQLRNPWGKSEHGSDGKDDGIFKMKLDDFMKLYNSINLGG